MQSERIRQTLSGPINLADIEKLRAEGWNPVAIEWERQVAASGLRAAADTQDTPYGLRVAGDCSTLEENPDEAHVLMTMMELIIQDGPYSSIAQELNRKGYLTREGTKWSPVSVFEMLPRLIDAGPKIFASEEWLRRRQQSRQQLPRLTV